MVVTHESRIIPVRREIDVYHARVHARNMAKSINFDVYAATEIETAVSEICTNVLHHGVEGEITLRSHGTEFEFICTDCGPGFKGSASRSNKRGLGVGLAGAGRLMDELHIGETPGGGGQVVGRKRLQNTQAATPDGWIVACALSPRVGEKDCGDTYLVRETGDTLLIAVIDGLGHGEKAACAAYAVRSYLTEHAPEPLPELIVGAHEVAKATRGAVIGVVRIELATQGVTYLFVGNVEAAILPRRQRLISNGGCVGVHIPEIAERRTDMGPGDGLLIWTDGLENPPLPERLPKIQQDFVEKWVATYGSQHDDTLALTVRKVSGSFV